MSILHAEWRIQAITGVHLLLSVAVKIFEGDSGSWHILLHDCDYLIFFASYFTITVLLVHLILRIFLESPLSTQPVCHTVVGVGVQSPKYLTSHRS